MTTEIDAEGLAHAMTDTIDVAALVERLTDKADRFGPNGELERQAADLLQSQADALAEARRENSTLTERLNFAYQAKARCNDDANFERRRATTAEASLATMREALEPSGDTKAAYLGEFYMDIARMDEAGDGYTESIAVSWTTIKEIMAAIKARALGGSNAE